MDIEQANSEATDRMMAAHPVVIGLGKALEVIPGMHEDLLLHAGPPITWARASGPMRGAITGALIFEGRAKNEAQAQKLIEKGKMRADIMRLFLTNVRLPEDQKGDLQAQIAALRGAENGVKQLVQKYGHLIFLETLDEIINLTERRARREIEKIGQCEVREPEILGQTIQRDLVVQRVAVAAPPGG